MRDSIKEYEAVQEAAMKFVKSVAEGDSKYARELFTDDAVLFGTRLYRTILPQRGHCQWR